MKNAKGETYRKIEYVFSQIQGGIAPHEFDRYLVWSEEHGKEINAKHFVGCTESALGRRLRELRELGRLYSKRRDGTAFVEYWIPTKSEQLSLV